MLKYFFDMNKNGADNKVLSFSYKEYKVREKGRQQRQDLTIEHLPAIKIP